MTSRWTYGRGVANLWGGGCREGCGKGICDRRLPEPRFPAFKVFPSARTAVRLRRVVLPFYDLALRSLRFVLAGARGSRRSLARFLRMHLTVTGAWLCWPMHARLERLVIAVDLQRHME